MKTFVIILIAVVAALILLFSIRGMLSKSGVSPGLADGKLLPCPASPNCVCSEFSTDTEHFIQPLNLPRANSAETLSMLKSATEQMGGTILVEKEDYIAATFTSALFGFVDDLEIRIDAEGKVAHLRSASRTGYSDLGVNAKRVTQLRSLIR